MTQESPTVNLLNYDQAALIEWFESIGERAFRAKQVLKWLHHHQELSTESMTDLSKPLRQLLQAKVANQVPKVRISQASADGTHKWLFELSDGNCIETVFIPENNRGTLCVSSQVGCTLNCDFCSTGKQGFNRNLSTAEIIGQLWLAKHTLAETNRKVTNVVLMGMGEPLYNYDNVLKALNLMTDDLGYGLSKRRVTLSTAGVVPTMERLKQDSDVALAVSLHATNNALRDILVPLNRKYPIEELMAVCRTYFSKASKRSITFEYVMLDGINDSLKHAKELIRLLEGVPAKVNLIPFNPFPNTQYKRSPDHVIKAFRDKLMQAGVCTITRRTRGDDIDAACGQLVGQVFDKTKRQIRFLNKTESSYPIVSP